MTAVLSISEECCAQNRRLIAQSRERSAMSRRILNPWWGISGSSDEPSAVPQERDSVHWPLDELERLVRDKLRRGSLFVLKDGRFWAGPATGEVCRVCSQVISRGNECEVRGPRGAVYAHLLCHRIWQQESRTYSGDLESSA